jgi:hypothetical protein
MSTNRLSAWCIDSLANWLVSLSSTTMSFDEREEVGNEFAVLSTWEAPSGFVYRGNHQEAFVRRSLVTLQIGRAHV